MADILHPPRRFVVAIIFEVPEDPRSDVELGEYFKTGVSVNLDCQRFGKTAVVNRVPPVLELHKP
jgi:hypothetical protein